MAQIAALAPASSAIDISHVSKSFQVGGARIDALRDITLSVEPGAFVSLVGPSGCGKSTLLRLIAGLDTADNGTISIAGRPVRGPGLDRGMVFQDHRLFPWLTVERNILLSLRRTGYSHEQKQSIVRDLIALVGLAGFEQAQPHQLSGGMSQRAAIARALAPRPDILLLDEPFGALDSLTRTRLQIEFLRIWKHEGITMLMVTHDVEEAVFLSDRVVVVDPRPGRIRRTFDIPLDRPRRRSAPVFTAIKDEILGELSVLEM
ncbi:MAG TPA: ABC transporter ATP-binding protein [Xanthobacteraceae bacterium]|jgi:sulfonate transport system ATP-binding protein|nr:ABC transporter ATP-binding protein [Xanthobacteraceae bacterium]